MQKKPSAWPAPAPVESLPDVVLIVDRGDWPPAAGGNATGTASVLDWDVKRDLTGGALPGQARGASGFSVASATATIPQPVGAPLTPWATTARRITPGGQASLAATYGPSQGLRLGRFLVDSISGSDQEGSLAVDLVESQRDMDGLFTYAWAYDGAPTEAAGVLAYIARAAGYRTSPTPFGGLPVVSSYLVWEAPLTGSLDSYPPVMPRTLTQGVVWDSRKGRCVLGAGSRVAWSRTPGDPTAAVWPYVAISSFGPGVQVSMGSGLKLLLTSTGFTITGLDGNPSYIWRETWSSPAADGERIVILTNVDATTASIRDSVTQETFTATGNFDLFAGGIDITVQAGGACGGISAWSVNPVAWAEPSALIEHTGSLLAGVFDVQNKGAREVFQDIARATMGAGWQSETGTLIYRNRASLRSGAPVERVEAETSLVDVPWVIRREEVADRIEVAYTPASVVQDPTHKLTLWEATEPIYVAAGRTATVYADITGTTDRISAFSIYTATSSDPANLGYSRWLASTSRGGGGARPSDDAIRIETTIINPSRVRLRITNTTGGALWLVDGNGNPAVVLRTSLQVQPGEQESVSWGAAEDRAVQPYSFEGGQWVQDRAAALEMLDWLISQMVAPLPTIPAVQVKPDLARQLGDVIVLTEAKQDTLPGDPEHIPLKTKALITGISLSGDAGGYDQSLSLALLGVTFGDFDRWGTNLYPGAKTFAAFDAWLVSQGILTGAQLDAYFERALVDA